MSTVKTNAILDASGGNTTTINGVTPTAYNTMGRNRIINGAMEIAQRGTSHSSTGYGSLDRWYFNLSGGTGTLSQETNANPSETGGLKNYARLNISTASDYTTLTQRIEDVRTVPSGTVTLSFYAKGTAPAAGLYVYGTQYFGSGGSSDVDISPVLVTSSLTSEWVKYSVNITIPSLDGKTFGTSSYFLIAIGQYSSTASTAYDLNITGVQLEVGSVATEFERRPYGTELALCQRYYQVVAKAAQAAIAVGRGGASGTRCHFVLPFSTAMRTTPTPPAAMTFYVYRASAVTSTGTISITVSYYDPTNSSIGCYIDATCDDDRVLCIGNNSSAVAFSAEL